MSSMEALVAFLRARLDEDEQEISKHPDGEYHEEDGYVATQESGYPAFRMLVIGKRRALQQVAVKRRLLDEYERCGPTTVGHIGLRGAVRILGEEYVAHPDFRGEWRP